MKKEERRGEKQQKKREEEMKEKEGEQKRKGTEKKGQKKGDRVLYDSGSLSHTMGPYKPMC